MMAAKNVAEYLVWFSAEHGDPVSNLKLQKLLYYAQAWFLALHDEPLFEAWVHGPVVPPIYGAYKVNAWQPIPPPVSTPSLPTERVLEHLNEVLQVYGGFSAYQLEQMTHSEEPWIRARAGIPEDAASHAVIEHSWMRDYYRARAAKS